MSTSAISEWIQKFLETDPPRSKSVTMTVFGDSIAAHGGEVWLGSLIALLTPFGISDRLVRTSVFRLADEGWLEARREGRRSLYALTPAGRRRVEYAYRRIYAQPSQQWAGTWTVVIAGPDMISAAERATLRKELYWEGFSMIALGVFVRPAGDTEVLQEVLSRTRLAGKLFVCQASELDHLGARPLRDFVEQGWELASVMEGYRQFSQRFGALATLLEAQHVVDAEQSFVIRTLLMHAFRRIQLHDPLLPLELLPENWPGTSAYELCRTIYQITYLRAEQHLLATLRREDENAPKAASHFYQRFGGLA
jgi:phenylacetic acid degradation operon negative regulatory protein